MPLQTGRDLHVDAVLSNIVIGRRPQGYIADQLVPVLSVAKQSNVFYKRNYKENIAWTPNLTAMAPGAAPKEVFWSVSSDTYFAKKYGLGTYWTAEDEVNSDDALQYDQESAEFVTDRLLIDYEARIANLANTSVFTTTHVATAWSDKVGGAPFSDLANQIELFRQRNTLRPNVLILPEQVATYVRRSNEVRTLLFGTNQGGIATDQQIANLLKVDKILVPEIFVNTAGPGETLAGSGTASPVWGNFAYLAYQSPLPGNRVDTWMQAFRWTNPLFGTPFAIRRHQYDEKRMRQDIDAVYFQAEKIISSDLCFRVDSVV